VTVTVWLAPYVTRVAPEGEMEPLAPAEEVMLYDLTPKVAAIVWLADTLLNV
jgi:hypothetical protein